MVNSNSDSHVMFLAPHSVLSWPCWSSFVRPLVLLCFSFEAQICYSRLPNPSHIREFTVFDPGLTLFKFRTSFFFFATPSQHNTASYIPNLNVPGLPKTFLCIFVPVTEFRFPLGFWVFPCRHHFRRSTLARSLKTGWTASGKECFCSFASPEWHSSWMYTNFHYHLDTNKVGVSQVSTAYNKDSTHSPLHGFQIVDIPPDG